MMEVSPSLERGVYAASTSASHTGTKRRERRDPGRVGAPVRVEIVGLVKMAAPGAAASDVLNKGRHVDENREAQALREPGEFYVGKAGLFVPMLEDKARGRAR